MLFWYSSCKRKREAWFGVTLFFYECQNCFKNSHFPFCFLNIMLST